MPGRIGACARRPAPDVETRTWAPSSNSAVRQWRMPTEELGSNVTWLRKNNAPPMSSWRACSSLACRSAAMTSG